MPKYFMPVGNTDFREIRETGLYYVDKTDLIDQLVWQSRAKVTLFTRPRRFGKSLNMSMLQHFFDIREDSKGIFEGLKVFANKALCNEWMNQYPTILVSFKPVESVNFENAVGQLKAVLADLFRNHIYLLEGNAIDKDDAEKFQRIKSEKAQTIDLMDSLWFLARLLYQHYNKQVILLIDEYDVPMAKGDTYGYYREITDIMRSMYGKALKDNPYIKMAVLTGCLRIAEESIFTGLNNLSVNSITDTEYDECFGFTNAEMDKLLSDTELSYQKSVFKEWYDGYTFGNTEVYCPWDVLNFIKELQKNPKRPAINYWANTSENDVIKRFLESDFDVKSDFEILLNGGYIEKIINPNITYGELIDDETNLWSILYMTGYLTILPGSLPERDENDSGEMGLFEYPFKLRLPNKEIKLLFEKTVVKWFKKSIVAEDRTELFNAIWNGDAETMTDEISGFLNETISYYDYNENFYHAFLAGLLSGIKGITVKSNRETGKGRSDIVLKYPRKRWVAIFELKNAKTDEELESCCDIALQQIEDKRYADAYKRDKVIKYGVAFHEKDCIVKKA